MKHWLTTAELAALGLPGMPGTRQGWDIHAEREGWLTSGKMRARKGRGGGVEFHIDLLPPAVMAVYASRAIGKVELAATDAEQASAAPQADALTLAAVEGRDARLALVAAADRFAHEAELPRVVADKAFCALYLLDKMPVDQWVRQAVKKLSPRTLDRWRALKKEGAHSRLGVDRGAARRGKGVLEASLDGAVKTYILALIAHQPHLSSDHVRALVADKFAGIELPAPRTFRHALGSLKERYKVELTTLTNPDAFKSKYRLSGRNSHPVERLNELWMIDASPADVLLTEGRHSIYACVDIFSRRLVVTVTRTPRAEAVALLIRRAILQWGVPERIKTDNGSDFVAKTTQRLFASLEIETEASDPFSPEQKGHIERAIGTLQRDLMPLLPGFIGHSVADRKVIEARKAFAQRLGESDAQAFCVEVTAAELQTYCDEWVEHRYAHRPHSGLRGRTPFQAASAFTGAVRRIEDIRALDLLLAPIAGRDGLRVVTKSGVRIDHAYYMCPTILPETQVFVRMDPADMGRAWCFSADGATFLGEAICPELAGIDPAAAVAEARAAQKALLDEGTAAIRAEMRKIKPRHMVDAVVRKAAKDAGKLVEFPKPVQTITTPALDAAREALDSGMDDAGPVASPPRRVEEPAATVARLPESKGARFRRALALEERLVAGQQISTEEAMWLGGYQAGAEYAAMRGAYEDFGEAALR